jgi:hypothetical protein
MRLRACHALAAERKAPVCKATGFVGSSSLFGGSPFGEGPASHGFNRSPREG